MSFYGYNNLSIDIYSSGTTILDDVDRQLKLAQDIRFDTFYPGGLYGTASYFIPRRITDYLASKGSYRTVIRNGLKIVYEGQIDNLDDTLRRGQEGTLVTANGYWGTIMDRRRGSKRWADNRITDDVWLYDETANAADVMLLDRNNRMRLVPKNESFANGDWAGVNYKMPTGSTVVRITFDYDLQEGGQSWEMELRRSTDGSSWTSETIFATSSGTGSVDQTLGTDRQWVQIRLTSKAAQTPTSDGTYYGEVSNVMVYSETGSIDMTEIAKDIIANYSSLNSSERLIDSNTYSLEPFFFDGFETLAQIIIEAAGYGDSSQNHWHPYIHNSEQVASPDGKPLLGLQQRPALTSHDYAVRMDDENLVMPVELDYDHSQIWNWIIVEYVDDRGFTQFVTPDDDATLEDTDSQTDYGQRDYLLNVGEATQAMAINYGVRFLNRYKDPQYRATGPIGVRGYILSDEGYRVPSSEIIAGQRLKIENYLQDLSGTGLTFLISGTSYNDNDEICSITTGRPPEMIIPEFEHPRIRDDEVVDDADDEDGGRRRRGRRKWRWSEMTDAQKEWWLGGRVGKAPD